MTTNPTDPRPATITTDAVAGVTVAEAVVDARRPCRGCGRLLTDRQRGNGLKHLLDHGEHVRLAGPPGVVHAVCEGVDAAVEGAAACGHCEPGGTPTGGHGSFRRS